MKVVLNHHARKVNRGSNSDKGLTSEGTIVGYSEFEIQLR